MDTNTAIAVRRDAHAMARSIMRRTETYPDNEVAVWEHAGGVVVTPSSGPKYDAEAARRRLIGVYDVGCPEQWLADDLKAAGVSH